MESDYALALMNEFLRELTALSRKYGIYIGGCGCCGSPYLLRDTGVYDIFDCEYKIEFLFDYEFFKDDSMVFGEYLSWRKKSDD